MRGPKQVHALPDMHVVGVDADTARSSRIFPGSCVAKGLRHGANAAQRTPPNPVFSAVRSNITAPAWDTIPVPMVSTDNDG